MNSNKAYRTLIEKNLVLNETRFLQEKFDKLAQDTEELRLQYKSIGEENKSQSIFWRCCCCVVSVIEIGRPSSNDAVITIEASQQGDSDRHDGSFSSGYEHGSSYV